MVLIASFSRRSARPPVRRPCGRLLLGRHAACALAGVTLELISSLMPMCCTTTASMNNSQTKQATKWNRAGLPLVKAVFPVDALDGCPSRRRREVGQSGHTHREPRLGHTAGGTAQRHQLVDMLAAVPPVEQCTRAAKPRATAVNPLVSTDGPNRTGDRSSSSLDSILC